jgi:FtsZ-interacting cell division protein ZipA
VIRRKIDTRIPWGIIGFSVLLVALGVHGIWSFRRERKRHEAEQERRRRMREERRRHQFDDPTDDS